MNTFAIETAVPASEAVQNEEAVYHEEHDICDLPTTETEQLSDDSPMMSSDEVHHFVERFRRDVRLLRTAQQETAKAQGKVLKNLERTIGELESRLTKAADWAIKVNERLVLIETKLSKLS